jgi:6-phosphofructokinase 1
MARQGGTIIGSSRSRRFRTPDGRKEASRQLDGFDGLVVVGGNGSLAGAHLLAEETGVRVLGIPASIDNDIGCTSMALGVDTALNTIVEACDRISDTAGAHHRVFIVEVMGRDSGYLAMASSIAAGADGVLFREQGRGSDEIMEAVSRIIDHAFSATGKRRVLIIKAEGVGIPCTRLARDLEDHFSSRQSPVEVRGTVLGHLVRGGRPSYYDRMIAGRFAFGAIEALEAGASDEMVAWLPPLPGGTETRDTAVRRFPLREVLAETERLLDGSSELTRWRVAMMGQLEGVLGL